jgi:hypothetical protein
MTLTAEERAWVEMMTKRCADRGLRVVGYRHTSDGLAVRLADVVLSDPDDARTPSEAEQVNDGR